MLDVITDITTQVNGIKGKSVLSDQGEILDISKYLKIFMDPLTLDFSSKQFVSKITSEIESNTISGG